MGGFFVCYICVNTNEVDVESIRNHALAKNNVEESFPFGNETLVFKVKGKIFLLLPLDSAQIKMNVKCNPEQAIELREQYPENILPGYHMNKKHWNTIIINNQLKKSFVFTMIDQSYQLVTKK